MKSYYFLVYLLLMSTIGFAQNYNVGGFVKEAVTGLPVFGVNVQVKKGTQTTITDIDGKFSLKQVPANAIIVFTSIGRKSVEYTVKSDIANLSISLQEAINSLDEIVVVGYGLKKKKDVTGSITVLSSKTIDELRPIKAEQALQGTIAGVVVSSQSGAPGAGLDIRIRGISTNGFNGPLVLVDGYQGGLDLLNPTDIESITVLKDAQAAVYGAIGANGVILVTTKQGKKNSKTKISFNSYTGTQETTKKLRLLNATEYALLLNESYANAGLPIQYPNVSGLGSGTNWQNEVFSKAPILSNDLSISGGSEKITYSLSASNLKQEGIVGLKKSGFDRSTIRIALASDLSEKLKLSTNYIFTDFNRKSLNENGLGSVLFNAINTPSILSVFDGDGNYTLVPASQGFGNEVINPLAQIENTYNEYNLKKLSGTTKLDYLPLDGLKLTTRIGFNISKSAGKSFSKKLNYGPLKVFNVERSAVNQNTFSSNDYSFDFFAEYEKKLFRNHKFKLMLGTSAFQYKEARLSATGYDIPYNSWEYADLSLSQVNTENDNKANYASNGIYRRLSHFATLDYDFKGRYLVSFIGRRDLSSRFGADKRVAYFSSILVGWVVSEEPFFQENNTVNFLKLRASYGRLGNDAIGDFRFRSLLNGEATYVFDNQLVNGTAPGIISNEQVQWEADKKFDLGMDTKFFKNKIDFTADYFVDTRSELLIIGVPVSGILGGTAPGSGSPTVNAGTVRNKGFELTVNYKSDETKKFKYRLGFNITTLKNEVTEVRNNKKYVDAGSFGVGNNLAPTRMQEGYAIGSFFGYVTDGIFQNQAQVDAHPSQLALGAEAVPGDLRFKDINGDGVINDKDIAYIGKPIADYTLGFNLNLEYKNFDFIAYAYASVGNEMIRNYERTEANLNKLEYTLDRWTGEGTSNSVPRVTAGASANKIFSDYFVEDASFLRIQNIQLGYSIKGNVIDQVGITKLRFYTAVSNLYTFTKYRGYDPSANSGNPISGGIDYGFYPTPKTYMVGVNVNF